LVRETSMKPGDLIITNRQITKRNGTSSAFLHLEPPDDFGADPIVCNFSKNDFAMVVYCPEKPNSGSLEWLLVICPNGSLGWIGKNDFQVVTK